jgi:DNA-binding MarR family transcriptional regulator
MSMRVQGSGETGADASAVNRDILDALTGLVKLVGGVAQGIASEFDIAPHDLLAMFKLEGVLSMKELAQHMGCDASFITSVADTLERRGFARREPSQRDRRVKNLVLTEEGIAAKERLMRELAAKMPWSYALDDGERRCFLTLLQKALDGAPSGVCLGAETPADDAEPRDRSIQL